MDVKRRLNSASQKCQSAGVKFTDKRASVLAILLASEHPLSAYELVAQYNRVHDTSMQPMSVYRILDLFVELELVHKLASSNKYVACFHLSCDHNHGEQFFLVCKSCGASHEVGMTDALMEQIKGSAEAASFQLLQSQFELSGLCQNCQAKVES
ncbi:Fur family transcriptional regulator [Echinimonas agarilytica]|uniref:Transcriptional repressor n=1 Tax=Echinimonas agarilytica TaxID=1215918 RepID=A0AA41W8P0_9GAMM|nr:Fur family transcriptional regulator [Echinimonas agarilytica]MCM2680361.1 transcriptional repressor [Echinimonas agarilytica]